MIEPLGKTDAQAILRGHYYGRLGCCNHNEPYVLPINYMYQGEDIYIHSLPGLKIQTMRANPKICLQVDEVEDDYNWRSVIAFGDFEEITNADEGKQIMAAMFRHLPHLTPVESRIKETPDEVIVFRLRVNRITGVSEHWR